MKSNIEIVKKVEVTLTLTKLEAYMLKVMMQNHPDPKNELIPFRDFRIKLFEAMGKWDDLED